MTNAYNCIGKASRLLAAKLALCSRVDALGDQTGPTVAIECKSYIDRRLEELQDNSVKSTIFTKCPHVEFDIIFNAIDIVRSFEKPSLPKYQPNRESSGYDTNVDVINKRSSHAIPNDTIKRVKAEV
jgi:nucleolar protein 58